MLNYENKKNDVTERRYTPKNLEENLSIQNKRHSPNDYFIVTDHDYKNYDEND